MTISIVPSESVMNKRLIVKSRTFSDECFNQAVQVGLDALANAVNNKHLGSQHIKDAEQAVIHAADLAKRHFNGNGKPIVEALRTLDAASPSNSNMIDLQRTGLEAMLDYLADIPAISKGLTP